MIPIEEDDDEEETRQLLEAIKQSKLHKPHIPPRTPPSTPLDEYDEGEFIQSAILQSTKSHAQSQRNPPQEIYDDRELQEAIRQSMANDRVPVTATPEPEPEEEDNELEEAIRQSMVNNDQVIRQEQDKEFLESLKRDQAREMQQAKEIEKQEEEFNNQVKKKCIKIRLIS
jgi:hypothetical protein